MVKETKERDLGTVCSVVSALRVHCVFSISFSVHSCCTVCLVLLSEVFKSCHMFGVRCWNYSSYAICLGYTLAAPFCQGVCLV